MKSTIDKIVMDETKKEEIRQTLLKKKTANHTWVKVTATLAAAVAALMIIPFTRNTILQAAENVISTFKSKTGTEIKVVMDENNDIVSAEVKEGADEYIEVIDDRIYFKIDGTSTDITDQCSDSDFFRYEIRNDDGTYNLIYIGGTPSEYGWIEIIIVPDMNQAGSGEDGVLVTATISSKICDADSPQKDWEKKVEQDTQNYIDEIKGK